MLRFAHAPAELLQLYASVTPAHATFKACEPITSCFNCHWKSQQPVADNCNGWSQARDDALRRADRCESRASSFTTGRREEQHVAECTTCHINITKPHRCGLKPMCR
jgi:hypothetical protein